MAFVELPADSVQLEVWLLKVAVGVYDVPLPNLLSNKDHRLDDAMTSVVTPIQYVVLATKLLFNPESVM